MPSEVAKGLVVVVEDGEPEGVMPEEGFRSTTGQQQQQPGSANEASEQGLAGSGGQGGADRDHDNDEAMGAFVLDIPGLLQQPQQQQPSSEGSGEGGAEGQQGQGSSKYQADLAALAERDRQQLRWVVVGAGDDGWLVVMQVIMYHRLLPTCFDLFLQHSVASMAVAPA